MWDRGLTLTIKRNQVCDIHQITNEAKKRMEESINENRFEISPYQEKNKESQNINQNQKTDLKPE